jgi:hypothetical protein
MWQILRVLMRNMHLIRPIVVGKARQDLAQTGQVIDVKAVMVKLASYWGLQGNKIVYKNKWPSSLIMLEEGLEVVQSKNGIMRIQKRVQEDRQRMEPKK